MRTLKEIYDENAKKSLTFPQLMVQSLWTYIQELEQEIERLKKE